MAKGIHFRWIRLILDGILLLSVILAVIAYRQPSQASVEPQTQPQTVQVVSASGLSQENTAPIPSLETDPITNSVTLDNNTLAAMIAAENAALTPPQYMTGLPVITR
jgi:hypothetical protein